MRPGKGSSSSNINHDEDMYEEDDYASKKDGPSSNATSANNSNSRDEKNNDKASAIRSKHSVTEQRRRSKINERFQMLRDLIPHSEQKRDTASFLLEVIEYVQYLQERVQKYEGTYPGRSTEPAKLMPWRNSHWHAQNLVGHPQLVGIRDGSGSCPGSTFVGKFDENKNSLSPNMQTSSQDHGKSVDPLPEVVNKGFLPAPIPSHAATFVGPVRSDDALVHPFQRPVSDAQCSIPSDTMNQEELMIEGGTISFSSVYSQGLLNTLSQALQNAGVDLSHASVSVQIELGKRANRGLAHVTSTVKDHDDPHSGNHAAAHNREESCGEESDRSQKRLKT